MRVTQKISRILMTFIVLLALSAAAQAQATRTWVSGVGDDANPCSRTAPCKTFAGAISKTAAGGEINVLDPAGYGGVTITKSISIRNDGVGTAGVLVSGTNGIIINANPTDVVMLYGLDIEGLGTGLAGVRVLAAGAVYVQNCAIHNFTAKAIDFQPSSVTAGSNSLLFVLNTIIRDNKGASSGGVFVKPGSNVTARALLEGVQLLNNQFGVSVDGTAPSTSFTRLSNNTIIANSSSLLIAGTANLTTFGNNRILDIGGGVAPPAPVSQQ